jgi:predicted nucleic acid-binding protein
LEVRLAVDTNAYRAFTDGEAFFVEAVRHAKVLAIPVVVLGELRAGFRHGTRQAENEGTLGKVLAVKRVEVLHIAETTTRYYADVWSDLRKRGRPIPTNDIWISALCIENDFTLLTRDAHFTSIPGLHLFR